MTLLEKGSKSSLIKTLAYLSQRQFLIHDVVYADGDVIYRCLHVFRGADVHDDHAYKHFLPEQSSRRSCFDALENYNKALARFHGAKKMQDTTIYYNGTNLISHYLLH